ncbi:uncharacterized protein LOC136029356 isoform X3 [Artemia franciscana]|uniref:SAM domain-containing protein n=1 Tax=Artemia franciscana TaxID=6661 RepID=A0AA88KZU7_ARTSF|nr:hypothetical protein QYM36_015371 [Artemia franciscana]
MMQAGIPPPYRQPPVPLGSSEFNEPQLPGAVTEGYAQESLRAYSTKFPTDRSVVVNTSDKIAEVGRIQSYPPQGSRYQGGHGYPDQNGYSDAVPTAKVVWTDEQKLVSRPEQGIQLNQLNGGHPSHQQNYVHMARGADYGVVYPRGLQPHYGLMTVENAPFQGYGSPNQPTQPNQPYHIQQTHSPYYTVGEIQQAHTGRNSGDATPNSTLGRELIRDTCSRMYQQSRLPTSPELQRAAATSLSPLQHQGNVMNNNQPPLELKSNSEDKKGKILTKAYHQLKDVLAGKFIKNSSESSDPPDNENERNIGNEQRSLNNVGSSNPAFELDTNRQDFSSHEFYGQKPVYAMSSPRIARPPYVSYPSTQSNIAQQSPKLPPRPLQPVTQPQQVIGEHTGHVSGTSLSDGERKAGQSGHTSDSGIQNQWQKDLHNLSQESDLARHPSLIELSKSIVDQSSDWVDMTNDQSALDTSGHASDLANRTREGINGTPPLPPLDESPANSPKPVRIFDTSGNNPRPDLLEPSQTGMKTGPPVLPKPNAVPVLPMKKNKPKSLVAPRMGTGLTSNGRTKNSKHSKKSIGISQVHGINSILRIDESLDPLSSTTGHEFDVESILQGDSTLNSTMTQSEDDLSTVGGQPDIDPLMIRKQLEGLETMYFEVMKMLNDKKLPGGSLLKSQQRKLNGSLSSIPSSVSSRPIYRDKRKYEDRLRSRDSKSINKRFQRLESHVVTLARSVAHLSSEMRTQHLVIKEVENLRQEMSQLRVGRPMGQTAVRGTHEYDLWNERVKKLTNFFGDEPPLLRIFLRKLGYEKYASLFEEEKVGLIELPYLTEDRLLNMGIPLGPRLRIMQEARAPSKPELYIL